MKVQVSPTTSRRYALTLSCQVYCLVWSSGYAAQPLPTLERLRGKRGPKTRVSDADLHPAILEVLAMWPFLGERSRKVRARLSRCRCRRSLGGVHRAGHYRKGGEPQSVEFSATVTWGKLTGTSGEFQTGVDNKIDEVVGWHKAKLGDRWAVLEPIRQGVRYAFGAIAQDVARGLRACCDWGPQYIADAWVDKVKWLSITISLSYVGEPACNEVIERFIRTLKEQCLYLPQFSTLVEARTIIADFVACYNRE